MNNRQALNLLLPALFLCNASDQLHAQFSDEAVYQANNANTKAMTFTPLKYEAMSETTKKYMYKFMKHNFVSTSDKTTIVPYKLPFYSRPLLPKGHEERFLTNISGLSDAGLKLVTYKISSHAGGNTYLADGNDVRLDVLPGTDYFEGSNFSGLVEYVGAFDYVTVLGANRKIPHYKEVKIEPVSEEQINAYIDSGKPVYMPHSKEIKCEECNGFGGHTVNKDVWEDGRRIKNKRIRETCKTCNGDKKVTKLFCYKVTK
jgi:hypothetical protein